MPRRPLTWAAVVLVAASCVLAAGAPAVQGPRRIASHCSPSGDVCFGIRVQNGAVYLELSTVERYFGRYRLCVRPPGSGAAGRERCASFPVRRMGSSWGSVVKYGRHFPNRSVGVYRVTWKLGTQPLGPTLRFRLPLRR